MPSFLSFVTGPVTDFLSKVGNTVRQYVTTDKDRLEADQKLAELTSAFQMKLAELDTQWAQTQRDVIVAEATGHSWLQRNWRPMLMLYFAGLIGLIVWTGGYVNGRQLDHDFIMEILSIVKIGISGYVMGRSAEKIAPSVVSVFKK